MYCVLNRTAYTVSSDSTRKVVEGEILKAPRNDCRPQFSNRISNIGDRTQK